MTEPRTEAGRALVREIPEDADGYIDPEGVRTAVVEIERQATAAAEQRLRTEATASVRAELAEKVRALREVAEWDERRGMVGAPRWRPALSKSAILAILDAPVGPTTGRTWPSRDELAAMSSAEVNAFFESVGSDWRVADFPAPASSDTPDRHYAAATPTPVTPSPEGA